jgi:hypothetical protein
VTASRLASIKRTKQKNATLSLAPSNILALLAYAVFQYAMYCSGQPLFNGRRNAPFGKLWLEVSQFQLTHARVGPMRREIIAG